MGRSGAGVSCKIAKYIFLLGVSEIGLDWFVCLKGILLYFARNVPELRGGEVFSLTLAEDQKFFDR